MSLATFYICLGTVGLILGALFACVLAVGLARIVQALFGKPVVHRDITRW